MEDIVYVTRAGHNEELRYSLRTLSNLPHRKVFLVGSKPEWAVNVELLTFAEVTKGPRAKWANIQSALEVAAECPDISAQFTYMNDDFFIMEPMLQVEPLHGPELRLTRGYRRPSSSYSHGFRDTEKALLAEGCPEPFWSYELHVPLRVSRFAFSATLRKSRGHSGLLHPRTFYGNLEALDGKEMDDVKIHGRFKPAGQPFLSTSDGSFDSMPVGRYIRGRFPDPSPYEEG